MQAIGACLLPGFDTDSQLSAGFPYRTCVLYTVDGVVGLILGTDIPDEVLGSLVSAEAAYNRLQFVRRLFHNLADVLLFITLVELVRGLLHCVNSTPPSKWWTIIILLWSLIIMVLSGAAVGVAMKAVPHGMRYDRLREERSDAIIDDVFDRPSNSNLAEIEEELAQEERLLTRFYGRISKLFATSYIFLGLASLFILAFISYACMRRNVRQAKRLRTVSKLLQPAPVWYLPRTPSTKQAHGHQTSRLLFVAAIFDSIRHIVVMAISCYVFLDLRYDATSLFISNWLIQYLFDFVCAFVVFFLLFFLAARRRPKGLWEALENASQHTTEQAGRPVSEVATYTVYASIPTPPGQRQDTGTETLQPHMPSAAQGQPGVVRQQALSLAPPTHHTFGPYAPDMNWGGR